MERNQFMLTRLSYNREKSDVQVEWTMAKPGEDGALSYPNGSFGGPFVPQDALIDAMDAYKPHVLEMMGTNRDMKALNDAKFSKEVEQLLNGHYVAMQNDITVRKVSMKYNDGEPQVLTLSCYLRGPAGVGSAVNLSVRLDREALGYEQALVDLFDACADAAFDFVEQRGVMQLDVFRQ